LNEYRITYKQRDMPDDYVCKVDKWAHDEKKAVGYICKGINKLGRCTGKKGQSITILSVKQL
jgi:hypothetical protein